MSLQAEFGPWLFVVVPIVLASCDSADGVVGYVEGKQ